MFWRYLIKKTLPKNRSEADRLERIKMYKSPDRKQLRTDCADQSGKIPEGYDRDYFGIHHVAGGWVCREWAPDARQVYLTGDFNGWNPESHPMMKLRGGIWLLCLPGENALWEGCRVRTLVDSASACTAGGSLSSFIGTEGAVVVDDGRVFSEADAY